MAEFTPEIAAEMLSACQQGGEEAAGAFSRAWGKDISLAVGHPSTLAGDSLPDAWNGPGLVLAFHVGDSGALLLLPEASELLPGWCAEPNETERSKLATLAQELGYVLFPEAFTPSDASAARVKDLAGALRRAEPSGEVGLLTLTLTQGEKSGEASLVWPVQTPTRSTQPAEAANADVEEQAVEDAPARVADPLGALPNSAAQPAAFQPSRNPRLQYADLDDGIRQLPRYAKSLLKVRVPVTVTLASAKYPVSQILDLGPGSIIQFNKPCEENLTLEVGHQTIAKGEAVKVGDKFGLWITSMTMPDERFWVIHGRRSGARVK